MNILDLVIILILGLYVLGGIYKGFVWNLSVLGSYIAAWLLAAVFMSLVASGFVQNESLFNSMLSYTEGSEYIYDVEYSKRPISEISNSELDEIIERAALPFPIGIRVRENIEKEAFSASGVLTLGDYFNESMVMIVINIISFLIVYAIARILFAIGINWADYAFVFPRLRRFDMLVSSGVGLLRGLFAMFTIFMLVPIMLTVLPFEPVRELIDSSFFASFFHRLNFLLRLIPAV